MRISLLHYVIMCSSNFRTLIVARLYVTKSDRGEVIHDLYRCSLKNCSSALAGLLRDTLWCGHDYAREPA